MVPGFKYHVATIAAIFFALTVGLVVGSLIVSPQLADGQRRAIVSLRDTLSNDLASFKEKQARSDQFIQRVAPQLVKNQLPTEKVLILQTGDYPEIVSSVADTMKASGAEVTATARTLRSLSKTDDVFKVLLAEKRAAEAKFPADRNGVFNAIVASLLGDPSAAEMPALLRDADLLSYDPISATATRPTTVVIVGGSKNEDSQRVARIDSVIVKGLRDKGIKVLYCEGADAAFSDVMAYRQQKLEISTVDNANTPMGQCALVLAFNAEPDDYGVKTTARQILPAVSP